MKKLADVSKEHSIRDFDLSKADHLVYVWLVRWHLERHYIPARIIQVLSQIEDALARFVP